MQARLRLRGVHFAFAFGHQADASCLSHGLTLGASMTGEPRLVSSQLSVARLG